MSTVVGIKFKVAHDCKHAIDLCFKERQVTRALRGGAHDLANRRVVT